MFLILISQDLPSPFGGGDYEADALSVMQHLSQHSASAYMEAEHILSGRVGKAQDEEGEERAEHEFHSGRESDGKENRIVANEKQYGDMPLCSPGSLLVCLPFTSHEKTSLKRIVTVLWSVLLCVF